MCPPRGASSSKQLSIPLPKDKAHVTARIGARATVNFSRGILTWVSHITGDIAELYVQRSTFSAKASAKISAEESRHKALKSRTHRAEAMSAR